MPPVVSAMGGSEESSSEKNEAWQLPPMMMVLEEESDVSSTETNIAIHESLRQVVKDQKMRAHAEKLVQQVMRRSLQEKQCKSRRRQKNGLGHLTETWMYFVYAFESMKQSLRNQIEEFLELEEQKTLHHCILWMRPHVPGEENSNFWSHCHDAAAGSDWLPQALMRELTDETTQERGSPCPKSLELGLILAVELSEMD